MKHIIFTFLAGALFSAAPITHAAPAVVVPDRETSGPIVEFAAREVQRYTYLRTGELLPVVSKIPAGQASISLSVDKSLPPQAFRLHTAGDTLSITGGGEVAVLYGAYRFAELLGVRFMLHGDVIPDAPIPFALPQVDEKHKPLFEHRGIQPFHDFPEGPDWWSLDDYKTYIGQLAKLRMNWFGLHCYPEGGVGPEPGVWIGLPEDVNEDGTVKWAYPSRWASASSGGAWGYAPTKTSDFAAGAGLLFEGDDFGSAVTAGFRPFPKSPEASAEVFNRAGHLFSDTFGFAERLGVHTVIGTETPLTIPKALQARLREKGLDPKSPETIRKLYEGMFLRISRAHPLGSYWLWTPEKWTWSGNTQQQLDATLADFSAALGALKTLGNPFGFATCGWVLGPSQDRSLFDNFLPRDNAIACINQQVGFAPIDPGFLHIKKRPNWAIPWLEDDPAMVIPQLWAGRMRRDAADAYAYGCTGLLGIHWRTKILAPNIAALAAAGWDQHGWNPEPGVRLEAPKGPSNDFRLGGKTASSKAPVARSDDDAIYRTCRYDVGGYKVRIPNGTYKVTLKFCEIAYEKPGKRIFGVKIQGREIAKALDVFAKSGKNTAFDLVANDVRVENETLDIAFTRKVEFPFVAGIVVDGKTADANQVAGKPFTRRINCGGGASGKYEADLPDAESNAKLARDLPRDLPIDDFYHDWCTAQFGAGASADLAALFTRLDGGGPANLSRSTRGAHLPRPATWIAGPGGIAANRKPWKSEKNRYAFVDEMETMRPKIRGAGNLARFDYWLNSFRYLRAVGKVGCTRGALDVAMQQLAKNKDAKQQAPLARKALAVREKLARDWETMITLQLAATDTVGAIGTVANLEQHTRRNPRNGGKHRFLDHHDKALAKALGAPLPDSVHPVTRYLGKPRIVVPSVRTSRAPDEELALKVVVLANERPASATLVWRTMGQGAWRKIPLEHVARATYRAVLPTAGNNSVEYRIEVESTDGTTLHWPAGAPALNQTVVVIPKK